MTDARFTLPSSVFLLFERAGSVLLLRRTKTRWRDAEYDLPTAHLTAGSANTAAAIRAAEDELDVTIDPVDLEFALLTQGHHGEGSDHYNVFFRVRRWDGEPRIMDGHKYDDLRWFGLGQPPARITPRTQLCLEVVRGGIPYVEYGFEDTAA